MKTIILTKYPNYILYEDGRVFSLYKKKFIKPSISTSNHGGSGYISVDLIENGKRRQYRLSKLLAENFIPNPKNLPVVDHIDRNPLNNSLNNLRWVTCEQNAQNRKKPTRVSKHGRSSKFNGVYWWFDVNRPKYGKWFSEITANKKRIRLGYFDSEIEAAKEWNKFAKKLHGEFANLNNVSRVS